ncbi:MAG: enoyl-CoA hydratase-related protein [Acidimicrobiales bacterium]
MATYERISVARDEDVITITLTNPAKRNTLARETMLELIDALTQAGQSDATGVMIAAEGSVFSAGHDFTDMSGIGFAEAKALLDICTEMMTLVQRIPQVVLAKVHALATAAGCQLVASCDLAIAADTAGFAAPGGKGGLFCHTPMVAISRAVGRKKGLEMALTGDVIDAETACQWGLVNRVVPADELDEACADLLKRATRGSAFSKAMGKHNYYVQFDLDQKAAYEHASNVMAAGVTTNDGQEGINSFIEKRRPTWTNS